MKLDLETGVKEELQDKLMDYLHRQGVKISSNGSRKFQCINPKHNDQKPSANIIPGTQDREWKCHGCQSHGDIFTAAHYLENKPIDGPGFLEDNILYLANLYHVTVPKTEMSEEEARRWTIRRAYRTAVQYMTDLKADDLSPVFLEKIKERQWDLDRARQFGVGQIPDYLEFKKYILSQNGFTEKFLEQIDLLGDRAMWMFRNDRMVFALLDHHGRPCGFAARDLLWSKDKDGPKYKNTSSVGLYQKGKLVYNLYEAKKHCDNRIFILEGYADVIASRLVGIDNCVALGGVHLTDDHIALLKNNGINHIVLALDGDKTGHTRTGEMIEKLADYPGLKVDVLSMPADEEEKDVDCFIRKNGAQAWADAQFATVTSFKWQLQNRPYNENKSVTLDKAVKNIIHIESPAEIYLMCEELSKELDIPIDVIREDVASKKDIESANKEAEIIAFSENVKKQLAMRPGNIREILSNASNMLSSIDKKKKWDPIDTGDQIFKCQEHIKKEDEASDSKGIQMGWPVFDSKMNGIPPNDTWIVLGGKANSGKTSMCASMVYQALTNNPDLIAVIYTIDDSYGRFMPRLISADTGIQTSWVSKRKLLEAKKPGTISKIQASYNKYMDLMRAGRLYIWDIRDGRTWAFADRSLAKLRKNNPKSKIFVIVDNFHLLGDGSDMGGESTERYAGLSKAVANSVKEHEIALVSTVEYHKLKKRVRPENQSIHRTQQLEYDAHLILHLVNYMDEFDNTKFTWNSSVDMEDTLGPHNEPILVPKKKPIVEMIVGKSKLEEFKGQIFFRFDPARCSFTECNTQDQFFFKTNWKSHNWMYARSE